MTNKLKFIAAISILFLLTSCDPKELTSEAYALGKQSGEDWRNLVSEVEVLSQWAGESSGETIEIPNVEKKSACRAMWILIGWPQFGLDNSAQNRKEFVEGCMTTIGS